MADPGEDQPMDDAVARDDVGVERDDGDLRGLFVFGDGGGRQPVCHDDSGTRDGRDGFTGVDAVLFFAGRERQHLVGSRDGLDLGLSDYGIVVATTWVDYRLCFFFRHLHVHVS